MFPFPPILKLLHLILGLDTPHNFPPPLPAAEEQKAPVIIQVYPRLINEEVGYYLAPVILAAAKKATVPVCFHLDHGPSELEVMKALRWGATGIMYDGSVHPYEENIANTKHIVETCASIGVEVEGELGHVGSVNDDAMEEYTDPKEAADFVKRTGVCCLAVLIGNAHGHYKKTPKLDIERVKAIREATGGLPLVLHGGSGIPDEEVKAAVKAGRESPPEYVEWIIGKLMELPDITFCPHGRPVAIEMTKNMLDHQFERL